MTDLVVSLRFKSDGTAQVVNDTRSVNTAIDGVSLSAGRLNSGMQSAAEDSSRALRSIARDSTQTGQAIERSLSGAAASTRSLGDEIKGARRDISALLALGELQKVAGDVVNLGDIVAAVFAGKAVTAIARYVAAQATIITSSKVERTAALSSAAAHELRAAEITKASSAAVFGATSATANAAAMQKEAAAASAAAIAERARAASMSVAARVMAGLGGPAGLIMLGVSALSYWAITSRDAAKETEKLDEANKKLAKSAKDVSAELFAQNAALNARRQDLEKKIRELQDLNEKSTDFGFGGEAGRNIFVAANNQKIDEYRRQISALTGETARWAQSMADASREFLEIEDRLNPNAAAARAWVSEYNRLASILQGGDLDAEVAKLNKEFAGVSRGTLEWAQSMADASREFLAIEDRLNPNAAAARAWVSEYRRLAEVLHGEALDAEVAKLNKEFAGATRSTLEWAQAMADSSRAFLAVKDRLNPNEAAARAWLEDYRSLSFGYSGDDLAREVEKLNKEFANGTAKQANDIAQIYEDTATSIYGSFRSMFRAVLDDGISGFRTLRRNLVDVFKDMLADMATLAIARPIIIPMVSVLGGALGVSGASQAAVIQQLGGGATSGFQAAGAGLGVASGLAGLGTFGTGLTAALPGFLGGAGGGFGAAASLAGTTTLGTTLGAFAGAALPWVAGAAILDKITGGGLFGTSWQTRDAGLELNVGGSDISAREYENQKKKRKLFGGSKRRTVFSDADAGLLASLNDTLDAGVDSILAGAAGLGAEAAEQILEGFKSKTYLSLKGKSDEEAQQLIQEWLDKTLTDMARAVLQDTRFSGLLIDGTKEMAEALFTLGKFFAADPLRDFSEQQRLASRTLKQQYDDQATALTDLIRAYDGSTDATQVLAAATQERYRMELALLQQISSVRAGVNDAIGSSIESIRQSVMAPDELYNYLRSQSEDLASQLASQTDPALIQQLVDKIDKLTSQAYDLIPEEQRAQYAQQFIDYYSGVQQTADDRLASIEQTVIQTHTDTSKIIQDVMERAAAKLEAAAAKQEAAAEAQRKAAEQIEQAFINYYRFGTR